MTQQEKQDTFKQELELIKNEAIREITAYVIGEVPDYFFEVAASSTGKYHPDYALGKGGLVRHTKAAVKIAESLLQLEQNAYLSETRDFIIAALLLHDCLKHGTNGSNYTVHDHPNLASEFVYEKSVRFNLVEKNVEYGEDEYALQVCPLIASHMGQWNTNKRSDVVLQKPVTETQKFVHMCDYLASRKFLEVNFDA